MFYKLCSYYTHIFTYIHMYIGYQYQKYFLMVNHGQNNWKILGFTFIPVFLKQLFRHL